MVLGTEDRLASSQFSMQLGLTLCGDAFGLDGQPFCYLLSEASFGSGFLENE